jgi:Clustered mitochondria/Translation initiation factor eIF3 subunit 135
VPLLSSNYDDDFDERSSYGDESESCLVDKVNNYEDDDDDSEPCLVVVTHLDGRDSHHATIDATATNYDDDDNHTNNYDDDDDDDDDDSRARTPNVNGDDEFNRLLADERLNRMTAAEMMAKCRQGGGDGDAQDSSMLAALMRRVLSQGRDGLPKPLKDWNGEFQELLAMDDSKAKYRALSELASDFVSTAKLYCRVIVNELGVPLIRRTIRPIDGFGFAGGIKYLCSGILFKFSVDQRLPESDCWMYGGDARNDEAAAKAASNELLALMAYWGAGVAGLHFPLLAVCYYKGFCLSACSVLPVDARSIAYGSCDSGITMHGDHEALNVRMAKTASLLNLRPHLCGARPARLMYSCGDLEGHIGSDGRLYLLDFGRGLPPQAPLNVPDTLAARRRVFYWLLRPELVRSHPTPLNPDAFSLWTRHDPARREMNGDIVECTVRLVKQVIPRFASEVLDGVLDGALLLSASELGSGLMPAVAQHPDDGERLRCAVALSSSPSSSSSVARSSFAASSSSATLIGDHFNHLIEATHRAGINVRHLGRVRAHTKGALVRSLVLHEMAARLLKSVLRRKQRTHLLANSASGVSDGAFKELAVDMFNLILCRSAGYERFWSAAAEGLQKKFALALSPAERTVPLYSLLQCGVLLPRLLTLTGFTVFDKAFRQLKRDPASFCFVVSDLSGPIDVVCKQMNIVEHSEALELFYQALEHGNGEVKKRLLAIAEQRFQAAVARAPSAFTTIVAWALLIFEQARMHALPGRRLALLRIGADKLEEACAADPNASFLEVPAQLHLGLIYVAQLLDELPSAAFDNLGDGDDEQASATATIDDCVLRALSGAIDAKPTLWSAVYAHAVYLMRELALDELCEGIEPAVDASVFAGSGFRLGLSPSRVWHYRLALGANRFRRRRTLSRAGRASIYRAVSAMCAALELHIDAMAPRHAAGTMLLHMQAQVRLYKMQPSGGSAQREHLVLVVRQAARQDAPRVLSVANELYGQATQRGHRKLYSASAVLYREVLDSVAAVSSGGASIDSQIFLLSRLALSLIESASMGERVDESTCAELGQCCEHLLSLDATMLENLVRVEQQELEPAAGAAPSDDDDAPNDRAALTESGGDDDDASTLQRRIDPSLFSVTESMLSSSSSSSSKSSCSPSALSDVDADEESVTSDAIGKHNVLKWLRVAGYSSQLRAGLELLLAEQRGVDVAGTGLDDESLCVLLDATSPSHVCALAISDNRLLRTVPGAESLAPFRRLERLDACRLSLDADTLLSLPAALPDALRTLRLAHTQLPVGFGNALAAESPCCAALRELDVRGQRTLDSAELERALCAMPSLRQLNVGGCAKLLSSSLCAAFAVLTELEHMSVVGCNGFDDDALQCCATSLRRLVTLDMGRTKRVTPAGFADRFDGALPMLATLLLDGCTLLDDSVIDALARRRCAPSCRPLDALSVRSLVRITAASVNSLIGAIGLDDGDDDARAPRTKSLDVSWCANLDGNELVRALAACKQIGLLASLDLSHVPLDGSQATLKRQRKAKRFFAVPAKQGGPRHILDAIDEQQRQRRMMLASAGSPSSSSSSSSADELGKVPLAHDMVTLLSRFDTLRHFAVSDKDAVTDDVCVRLSRHEQLRAASLRDCTRLTNVSAHSLAMLAKLEYIDVSASMMNDEGVAAICAGCASLRYVNLRRCSMITSDVCESLATLRRLRSLSLEQCTKIGVVGVRTLAQGPAARSLEMLNLARVNGTFNDDGIAHIARFFSRLEVLNVAGLMSVSGNALVMLVQYLPRLRELDLSGLLVEQHIVERIGVFARRLEFLNLTDCPRVGPVRHLRERGIRVRLSASSRAVVIGVTQKARERQARMLAGVLAGHHLASPSQDQLHLSSSSAASPSSSLDDIDIDNSLRQSVEPTRRPQLSARKRWLASLRANANNAPPVLQRLVAKLEANKSE